MGIVALRHVGSSQTRDQIGVPCIGRWILIGGTTTEVLDSILEIYVFCPFSYLRGVCVHAHTHTCALSLIMSQ